MHATPHHQKHALTAEGKIFTKENYYEIIHESLGHMNIKSCVVMKFLFSLHTKQRSVLAAGPININK